MANQDKKTIWWIFFILGMGTLLPWNFFITPQAYWQDKLSTANKSEQNQTQNVYQEFWAASLGLTTMMTNFVCCLLTSILMKKISKSIRFYVPMIGIGSCFAICAAMAQMDSTSWVSTFFISTLVLTIIITMFCAVFQASLFGLGGCMGGSCTAAIMAGQGAGGVFACVIDLVTKMAIPTELSLAACMYFVIAVIFMIISVGMFKMLQRMDAYQDIDNVNGNEKIDMKKSFINDDENENDELKRRESESKSDETAFQAIRRVVWPYHLVLILCFTMTLSIFPGVVAGYTSVNYEDTNYYNMFYLTIWVFLNFNFFDSIGRSLAGPMSQPESSLNIFKQNQPAPLVILTALRFLLIPVFFKCIPNIVDGVEEPRTGVFNNDYIFVISMMLMSFTNGLFSGLAMIYGPKTAPEHLREQIGGYMGTTLVGGLFLGALLGIPFVKLCKTF